MLDQTSARALARASYTLDLSGLTAHALDTLTAYARRITPVLALMIAELPRSHAGPGARCHAEHHVPDSVRMR